MTDVLKKSPKKMVKIRDLLQAGFLKPNEEIYMEFRGLNFTGRITQDGKLQTSEGVFKTMPEPTFLNLIQDPKYKKWYIEECIGKKVEDVSSYSWQDLLNDRRTGNRKKAHIVSGWLYWKNWNGVSLDEFRKRLEK